MTNDEFLESCRIPRESPDGELAVKLLDIFSSLSDPETLTPDMPCKSLKRVWRLRGSLEDGFDPMGYVLWLEDSLGTSISDTFSEYLIFPERDPECTMRELILNHVEILNAQKQGTVYAPRYVHFWTGPRLYRCAAWGFSAAGTVLLVCTLVFVQWLTRQYILWPVIFSIAALTMIWLGARLWKRNRIVLDRLKLRKKYRSVIHRKDTKSVLLEEIDFSGYNMFLFPDAEAAEKCAAELIRFPGLPLESANDQDDFLVLFRMKNPVDWAGTGKDAFFSELSSFCGKCRDAWFGAEVDRLLNILRRLCTFQEAEEVIRAWLASFPSDVFREEREILKKRLDEISESS